MITRRLAILSALSVPVMSAAAAFKGSDELLVKAGNVNHHCGNFYRSLIGCEPRETDAANCHASAGTVDYREFREWSSAAKGLL